ncbi:MAG TPA: hypothetical protein VG841_13620 [Caulobacterales bacterium]|nr:hypothetical protein [Caulobacterales bacterium]
MNARAALALALGLLNGAAWGLLLLVGFQLIAGIAAQRAAGYPSPDQIAYFIGLPVLMLAASAGRYVWLRISRNPRQPFATLLLSSLILLPYLMM